MPPMGTRGHTPTSPGTRGGKTGPPCSPPLVHTPHSLEGPFQEPRPPEPRESSQPADTEMRVPGKHGPRARRGPSRGWLPAVQAPGARGAGRSPGSRPGQSWWLVWSGWEGREGREGTMARAAAGPPQSSSLPEHPRGDWQGLGGRGPERQCESGQTSCRSLVPGWASEGALPC